MNFYVFLRVQCICMYTFYIASSSHPHFHHFFVIFTLSVPTHQYCTWLDCFITKRCEKRSLCSTTFAFLGHHIISIFYHHDCCFCQIYLHTRPNAKYYTAVKDSTTLHKKIIHTYTYNIVDNVFVCVWLPHIITLLIWKRKWKLLFQKRDNIWKSTFTSVLPENTKKVDQ